MTKINHFWNLSKKVEWRKYFHKKIIIDLWSETIYDIFFCTIFPFFNSTVQHSAKPLSFVSKVLIIFAITRYYKINISKYVKM